MATGVVVTCSAGTAKLSSRDPFRLVASRYRFRVNAKPDRLPSGRRVRVRCETQTGEVVTVRKYAPYLERRGFDEEEEEWKVVPDIWRSSAEKFGDRTALVDPYHDPPTNMTYKQLEEEILAFSEGLRVIGVQPHEKLALFADNSCRWLVADQGMMAMGAINVVRGSRSSVDELLQIYSHSESVALVVDNPELFSRIAKTFCSKAAIRFVILLWGEKSCLALDGMEEIPVYSFKEVIDLGKESRQDFLGSSDSRKQLKYEEISPDDIATLVYTSGTTGNPKGVMLSHKNLLHQINNLWDVVPCEPGNRFLSMLPPWHAYERACEYFIFTHGIEQMYTTVKHLKDDLRRYQPQYLVSVPLVFETLYSGIQKQFASSAIRKAVALSFIKISLAYMECKRIYEGTYLTSDSREPSKLGAILDWLQAKVIASLLLPLHLLATMLIYKKIHSAIGISKVLFC